MIEIIVSREQITPEWLSASLSAAGIKAKVTDVDIQPIIAGYYGCSSRLTLQYETDDPSLPRSLFLKMATEHETARANAAEGGMYRYEVGFYKELASKVNISTPHCYAAEISEDGTSFNLLLEDAAPFVQIDQLQGMTLEESRLALQELAGLHASTWQGKGMENCDWAKIDTATVEGYAQAMIGLTPVFLERFGADISAENAALAKQVASLAAACWHYQITCKNQAAVHCDYRGDNMLFGERNGDLAMTTIDWVGHLSGSGRDVAHFLGTSLRPEIRQEHEAELLSHYHKTLTSQGVGDFSLQDCINDYRRSLIYPLFVVVSATASVDIDERGQKLFLSMFNRTCAAIKDSNALDLMEAL